MDADAAERRIVEAIARSGIRLRHDKVVLRLVSDVRAAVGPLLAPEHAIVFTLTAPIKLPGKTAAALRERLPAVGARGWSGDLHGNAVHVRRLAPFGGGRALVLGFVHNRTDDAERILDRAAQVLEGSGQPPVEE